jgi:DNA replication ATP-dependent helicase Dna2
LFLMLCNSPNIKLCCAQVALMQRLAKQRGWAGLEALTIDKCQGWEKDVVLLSLVRSNKEQNAGKILADERRINVALTRAKLKLVVLGAQRTLCCVPVMRSLWELCNRNGWALPVLPEKPE